MLWMYFYAEWQWQQEWDDEFGVASWRDADEELVYAAADEGNLEMTEQKSHRFMARYDLNRNILNRALIHAFWTLNIINEYRSS